MDTLQLTRNQDFTIVQMNRGKANAINYQMVQELRQVFREMEKDPAVKGVILSGQPHYFSAGLDLIELIQYDKGLIEEFFTAFGSLFKELQLFSKPFISAITGHAPAGGCVLAVASDNRIMAAGETYRIGLNEIAVNVQISQDLVDAYAFWLGEGRANRYILDGKLLSGAEAVAAGLVDELVPLNDVLEHAENKMLQHLQRDQEIWRNTKKKTRKNLLEKLGRESENSLEEASRLWWKPEIRTKMKAYVQSFGTKKKQADNLKR